jgi:uncharacterized 2Fe-2S/4Fe-4S cluster protein (DUF4445 family)
MKVTFLPWGKSIVGSGGESILELCRLLGLPIAADCGGRITCGKCRVKLISGDLSPMDDAESALLQGDSVSGVRLACRAYPLTDCVINLNVPAPELKAKTAPVALPEGFSPDKNIGKYGAACDIGTTSMALLLWDMENARLLATAACENPQRLYGADVISRISFSLESDENLEILRSAVTGAMSKLLDEAAKKAGLSPRLVTRLSVVGNTAMSHLFLGKSPAGLASAPFKSDFRGAVTVSPREAGIEMSPEGEVYIMPNMESHVGSDITAGLLVCRPDKKPGLQVFVDVGTNGEIAAASGGRLLICSTAAGPAFEGASIKCGMRAASGAVRECRLENGKIKFSTVDNDAPIGLCGSGIIDLMAVLLDAGAIDKTGRLLSQFQAQSAGVPSAIAQCLMGENNSREFRLTENIVLTQQDIRAVQLVKSAIRSGIQVLTDMLPGDIENLTVAGAFGSSIRKESAVRIGLFPDIEKSRIILAGNTASVGASMALMSESARSEADALSKRARHVELATSEEFQGLYMNNMMF